ncbi:MAG: HAD family hydrolase [Woeseiaceae bacterium]
MRSALVIFDMDGVLLDSEPVHIRLERDIFSGLGLAISDSELNGYVGMAPRTMWTLIRERHGLRREVGELVAAETAIKVREFGRMTLQAVHGVEELIRELTAAGHGLAIASSSSARLIDTVVQKLGLRRYFPHRVSAEEVAQGKPAPDIFLEAAARCARRPGECVVIEDSANGVRAARAAGMACVGFVNRTSGDQDLTAADLLVEDFGATSVRRILRFIEA